MPVGQTPRKAAPFSRCNLQRVAWLRERITHHHSQYSHWKEFVPRNSLNSRSAPQMQVSDDVGSGSPAAASLYLLPLAGCLVLGRDTWWPVRRLAVSRQPRTESSSATIVLHAAKISIFLHRHPNFLASLSCCDLFPGSPRAYIWLFTTSPFLFGPYSVICAELHR